MLNQTLDTMIPEWRRAHKEQFGQTILQRIPFAYTIRREFQLLRPVLTNEECANYINSKIRTSKRRLSADVIDFAFNFKTKSRLFFKGLINGPINFYEARPGYRFIHHVCGYSRAQGDHPELFHNLSALVAMFLGILSLDGPTKSRYDKIVVVLMPFRIVLRMNQADWWASREILPQGGTVSTVSKQFVKVIYPDGQVFDARRISAYGPGECPINSVQ